MTDTDFNLDCCLISVERKPDGEVAMCRLVGFIVGNAIRENACEVQLLPRSKRGGFKVFYRLRESDELQEQFNLPSHISGPLRAHLENLADGNGSFSIDLTSAEHQISIAYEFKLRAETSTYAEMLVLTIQPAPL